MSSGHSSSSFTSAPSENVGERRHSVFLTTHWSAVLKAGSSDTASSRAALEKLCRTYWYPLYAYVRRRGQSAEDAKDLTQEFFVRLLRGNWVGVADQQRGRFRSFLLFELWQEDDD